MNPRPYEPQVDLLIKELISYQLYMRKKEPLEGVDHKKRVRDRIWMAEGVDFDMMKGKGLLGNDPTPPSVLFDSETMRVRSGLLWFKARHVVLKGLRPLKGTIGSVENEMGSGKVPFSSGAWECLRSELLFPLFLQLGAGSGLETSGSLAVDRQPQTDPGDISPEQACMTFLGGIGTAEGEETALDAIFSPFRTAQMPRVIPGQDHKDLASILFSLFELDEKTLSEIISSGSLQRLCREVLHSNYLEGLLEDLSTGPDGSIAVPGKFKERLGEVMMEGEAGDRFHRSYIRPAILRLGTCSAAASEHLLSVLKPLMDGRSTPELLDLLFKVPQGNRPALISLLGATRDRSAVEPLKRLMDYSSVESDVEAATKAIDLVSGGP